MVLMMLVELSQGDEDELVAVRFAGLFDLERGMHRYPLFLWTGELTD